MAVVNYQTVCFLFLIEIFKLFFYVFIFLLDFYLSKASLPQTFDYPPYQVFMDEKSDVPEADEHSFEVLNE